MIIFYFSAVLGLAALLVFLFEFRKGRASFEAASERVWLYFETPSSSLSPEDFEALTQKVNRIDREYEDWILDAANALHKAELERTRVEQTIRRALDRAAKGEDGQSALEALAEEHGIENAEPSGGGEVLRLHEGMDVRSGNNWPGRAEALERRWSS